jgi:hypothetical protein
MSVKLMNKIKFALIFIYLSNEKKLYTFYLYIW